MSCIVWNAWGLGNPRAFGELRRLVKEHKPSLLFLSETRLVSKRCCRWRDILEFDGMFVVDCIGKSGEVAIYGLLLKTRMLHFEKSRGKFGRLYQDESTVPTPGLVGGDFNEICFSFEKWGGRPKANSQMENFREILEFCELRSMHENGEFFTWVGRNSADTQVFERLERFLNSEGWQRMYPTATTTNLEFFHSDHRPVKISLGPDFTMRRAGRNKNRFRFESCWLLENEFEFVVEAGWRVAPTNSSLQERLRICGEYMNEWAGARFRRLSKRIKDER
ncbi:hypothetical protein DH2020_024721 [Rehmannia glutinosa]|uniref:Endonuclease/exonuclease/phosphatase domain-containing protein n=1 Tax=Rehmannia glutinosa TaxID=99300 RepID=A0ABR0W4D9_REHGL